MKKVLFSILGVLSILLVSGCVQQQTVESSSPLPTQSEFSLSHGVSSIDILTEDLTFTGAPVHLTYEFETGNVDSNIGLLLFLNGDIQPFSVDDNYPSVMNIVSLPANQKKVISLSFEPITGLAGDYLPLHTRFFGCALRSSPVLRDSRRVLGEASDAPAYPNTRHGAAPMSRAAVPVFGEMAVGARGRPCSHAPAPDKPLCYRSL